MAINDFLGDSLKIKPEKPPVKFYK